ncbi:MAG: hypothetical protein FWJ83_10105, partial [Limnochordales bacterium]
LGVEPVTRSMVSESDLVRHDAALLTVAIEDLWQAHRARDGRPGGLWLARLFPAATRRGGL